MKIILGKNKATTYNIIIKVYARQHTNIGIQKNDMELHGT